VKPVETTIEKRFDNKPPEYMIGENAYCSEPLDENLRKQHGAELIEPHKANRMRPII